MNLIDILTATMLIESRVDDFRKLLYPSAGISGADIDKVISNDPSSNHKHLMWMGKMLQADPKLDIDELLANVKLFNKVASNVDLYQFKDYDSFMDELMKKSKEVALGKRQQIKAGSEQICSNKRWLVVVPNTHDASRYFGGSTEWCISTSNVKHWNNYHYSNTIIMIKDRNRKPDDRWFKMALVGNAENQFYWGSRETKDDKINEIISIVDFWNLQDHRLGKCDARTYLQQLPEELIDDIASYFESDDVSNRQSERAYELAQEHYNNGGKEDLISDIYTTVIEQILETEEPDDFDSDDYYVAMNDLYKNEIDNGSFDELLQQVYNNSMVDDSPTIDTDYTPYIDERRLKQYINDSDYDYDDFVNYSARVIKEAASVPLLDVDKIIQNILPRDLNNEAFDRYVKLKTMVNAMFPKLGYYGILRNALRLYNDKINPKFTHGQQTFGTISPEFQCVHNNFVPKNIDDVLKVLDNDANCVDIAKYIRHYRKDLRENKKKMFAKFKK